MGRQSDSERQEATPSPTLGPDGGLPSWADPQLATLTKERFSDPGWIFERKLDGERCIAFRGESQKARLLTRNDRDVTSTFPEIAEALDAQRQDGFVVDGEIVALEHGETSFSLLQQRLGVVHPEPKLVADYPVVYYVFDILYAGDRDARPLPEIDRKRLLEETLSFGGPLQYTEQRVGDGEAFYRYACEQGWEGLIAKRADAPYVGGRTRNWLKFKCISGQEFVIGGFTDPRRSRQGFGALLLGYYDSDGRFTYAGKVGTGFNDRTLRSLRASLDKLERDTPAFSHGDPPHAGVHWVEPRLVCQIEFAEWTRDGLLRQPRYEGLRDDKDASEVVRETPQ
jgi:bifunctional non-homologous end joining protein LigD